MKSKEFLNDYYLDYENNIKPSWLFNKLESTKIIFEDTSNSGGKIIFGGNGASAAIASHAALDFTKQGKIKSTTYHDPSLITAYSNDYGYENWFSKVLESHLNKNDSVVLISVSGESSNMLKAAEYVKSQNIKLITFTGKNEGNSLKNMGDINFWVNSEAYNIVEGIHMIWLTTVVDMIIGEKVYDVS